MDTAAELQTPDIICGGFLHSPAGLSWRGACVWEEADQQRPVPIKEVLLTCDEQAGGMLELNT